MVLVLVLALALLLVPVLGLALVLCRLAGWVSFRNKKLLESSSAKLQAVRRNSSWKSWIKTKG